MSSDYDYHQERSALIATLERHEPGASGKCVCGQAIGTSDGVSWTVDFEGHLANVLLREGWHR